MKKFKFQTTTDVFMQCKIRACSQQPCGICTGFGDGPRRGLGDVDLTPAEGEMYAPPVQAKVGFRDRLALVFPDVVRDDLRFPTQCAIAISQREKKRTLTGNLAP